MNSEKNDDHKEYGQENFEGNDSQQDVVSDNNAEIEDNNKAEEGDEQQQKNLDEQLLKYQLAKTYSKEKKYGEAAELYGNICQEREEMFGEQGLELADFYYLYAEALLRELQHSSDPLGDFQKLLKQNMEKKAANHGEKNDDKQEDDIMDIIWRCLEYSRLIYEKTFKNNLLPLDQKHLQSKLQNVHYLLAEFHAENDKFDDSIVEYEQSLQYASASMDYNAIADIHLQIYFAMGYANKEMDIAITHYEKALNMLQMKQKKLLDDTMENDDLLIDLQNRFQELKHDLKLQQQQQQQQQQQMSSSSMKESSSTSSSTGPKNPEISSSNIVVNDRNHSINVAAAANSKQTNDNAVNILEPRRKRPINMMTTNNQQQQQQQQQQQEDDNEKVIIEDLPPDTIDGEKGTFGPPEKKLKQ